MPHLIVSGRCKWKSRGAVKVAYMHKNGQTGNTTRAILFERRIMLVKLNKTQYYIYI